MNMRMHYSEHLLWVSSSRTKKKACFVICMDCTVRKSLIFNLLQDNLSVGPEPEPPGEFVVLRKSPAFFLFFLKRFPLC